VTTLPMVIPALNEEDGIQQVLRRVLSARVDSPLRANLGTRRAPPLPPARFPDAGAVVQTLTSATQPMGGVDILLVNPPSPDGGIWIRSQHRVGRRSRENMIWPQVSLAQLTAILMPEYTVRVVDCIATRMGWPEFERLLEQVRPRYYLTQVTAPTLRNDLYGAFLAKSLGARTVAFGTHVTPLTLETMRPFPSLDFVLRGEPEMTLRELLDSLEGRRPSDPRVVKMLGETSGRAGEQRSRGAEEQGGRGAEERRGRGRISIRNTLRARCQQSAIPQSAIPYGHDVNNPQSAIPR